MRANISKVFEKHKILCILILIIIVISVIDVRFLRMRNLMNVLMHASINGIMALAMTTLMIGGAFDLSIGSTLSITGMVALFLQPHLGLTLSILIALAAGCLIGAINGVIVTYGRVNAFITTLGTMIIIKALALGMNNSRPIPNRSEFFMEIGSGAIGPVPYPVIYFILFIIVFWLMMKSSVFGRNAYAIGGNELSAKLSGINVDFYKIMYFVLSGFCAALAGIILSSRLNVGSAVLGDATPLIVISAVILGGTSLQGGIGTIRGTVSGLLVIGVVNNGMDLLNVQSYYQLVVRGSILVSVVLIDAYYVKMKSRGKLTAS